MASSTPTPPKVKQCLTIGDWQFGCTATSAGQDRWLVASPDNGGHWATDDDVKDWGRPATAECPGTGQGTGLAVKRFPWPGIVAAVLSVSCGSPVAGPQT
jgi:hypothetical protein